MGEVVLGVGVQSWSWRSGIRGQESGVSTQESGVRGQES